MSMMPKARKFRISPDASFLIPGVKVPEGGVPFVETEQIGTDVAAPAADAAPATPSPNTKAPEAEAPAEEVAQPTGRQLRMARRIAQKHGIKVGSDKEAVEALRQMGIDPFSRSNMLQLVPGVPVPGQDDAGRVTSDGQLPAVQRQAPPPAQPSPVLLDNEQRASEIIKIQRDIAKRRRRRLALLATRLTFFVALPTLIAGFYFFAIATPMYATKSEFVIQQAEAAAGGAGGLGGLFSGTGFATQTDSISIMRWYNRYASSCVPPAFRR
ncbi:MAG: hypothetical protein AAFQ50_15850 [Pseudomonadota bacterium]